MHGASENDTEQQLRHRIAAVTLLLNDEGILGYSGHVSARMPDRDAILIQPFDQSRAELRPEHLLVCDMDGRLTGNSASGQPPSEVFIHTEIYKARPDVHAIGHFHHDLTTSFSLVAGVPLRPVKNHAIRWESGIPVHPDPGHVNTAALGRSLVATLGPHHALVIRAHGEVVVAESLPALLMDCVHFVENAQALYQAALLGPVLPLTSEEMAGFRRSLKRDKHAAKLWEYYVGRARTAGLIPEAWMSSLVMERSRPA
jgi:ribulose-5-phosphate 4-epimerase/fuculose-1-phosphate aldolase